RFLTALPSIVEQFPKSRWLFLTLTVRNCEITELSDTLVQMNKAWNKFIQRKDLKPIQGWIRTTEVTRGEDRSAHPHFHVLVMVPTSWFGKYYVKQGRWVELWRESLQANYDPNVDIRVVKPKKGSSKTLTPATSAELLQGAVAETLKYSTKADDLLVDEQWFLELTKQTHKKRFLATGGALKNILKMDQETNEDLIHGDDTEEVNPDEEGELVRFHWDQPRKEYHKKQD
ncbi:MAG: protein rep, partial [Thiolinea sp.]